MANESIIIKENDPNSGSAAMETSGTRQAKKPLRKADPYILGIYFFLVIFSIIEIFSASSTEVRADNIYGPLKRHAIFLLIGAVIVFFTQKSDYMLLKRWAYPLGIFSFGLLMASSLFGATINGAQRAIVIGGFTVQPAEIVKLAVVIVLARILGFNQRTGDVSTGGVILAAVTVVAFSAVLWVNGLTNMILLMGVSVAMFLIGGIQWKKLGIVALTYLACGGLLYTFKYQDKEASEFDRAVAERVESQGGDIIYSSTIGRAATQKNRVSNFLKGVSPEDEITDDNRQVWFANMAQAHGGLLGQGPGNSRESARLPLAFSDYIFSIIVEDTGLVGGVILLIFYLGLLGRAGVIAYRVRNAFPAFLIMGCALMIVFQALVHMAIVTGVFPVSGQPLPLISKGGTSILVMSAAVGVMLSVSRFARFRKDDVGERTPFGKIEDSPIPEAV